MEKALQLDDNPAPGAAACPVEGQGFKLLRYYAIASLAAFAIVATLLSLIYRQAATRDLLALGESKNVALTQTFANSLWPEFETLIAEASGLDGDELRGYPEMTHLQQAVREQMAGLSVVRVKVYDLEGQTVFSTETAQIGEDASANPGFLAARSGQVESELTHKDAMGAFEGEIANRDLIESYVPIQPDGPSGPITGVLEVYDDVTPLLVQIRDTQRNIVIGVALNLTILYFALFLIIRHGDEVIKVESGRRRRAEEALLQANDALEATVAERTEALRKANAELRAESARHAQAEAAARSSEKRFRTLYELSPDGIVLIDPYAEKLSWPIVDCNPTFCTMNGYAYEELVGKSIDILHLLPEDPDERQAHLNERVTYLERVRQEGTVSIEARHLIKSGEIIEIATSTRLVEVNGRELLMGIDRDITGYKRAQETLQRRNAFLEMLNELSRETSVTLEVSPLLHKIAELTGKAIDATSAYISDWNQAQGTTTVVGEYIGPDASASERVSDLGETYHLEEDFADRAEWPHNPDSYWVHHADDPAVPPIERAHLKQYGAQSVLGIPLAAGDKIVGYIELWESRHRRDFTDEEIELSRAMASQVSMTIQNARLYEELESYSQFLEQAVEERTGELRQAKKRVEAILDSVGDGLVVIAPDGRVLHVNPAFERQTGFLSQEIVGEYPRDLLPTNPVGREPQEEALAAVESQESWQGELIIIRKDGSNYDAEVTIAPMRTYGGEDGHSVISLRDISARKEVERMKDAFVSNVSHELRTPISGLKIYHSLLQNNSTSPEQRERYLAAVQRETERLNLIIESLLRLSRLDQGRVEMNFAPVDLNGLVAQYVADRQPLADKVGLTLTAHPAAHPPSVLADEGLLGQVLSILLTNALNYTPPGGHITVETVAVGQTPGQNGIRWAGLSVCDTGPGILPREQEHLFERFYRGKAGRQSSAPGTGLGLSIAKEIIERHEGRIEVESEGLPGKGATFTIWLPVARR
jgi:PAS domain S-box-containing protein